MASDEAVLLVRIEAQMRQFERAMARASGVANTTAGRIETRFRTMDRTIGRVGIGLGRSLLGPLAAIASARGIGTVVNAFQRIENALKVAGLEGEDLARTFIRLKDLAIQNGAPVESLVQLYSRLSIAQKGLGVNSAEILDFTRGIAAALRVSGKSAEEARGALLQLSQAMGSGIVRGEEFNAILDGLLPVAQAVARGFRETGGDVTKLRRLIVDGKVSSIDFFRAFKVGQADLEGLARTTDITLGQAFINLQTQLITSVGKINDLTGASRVLIGVMSLLGGATVDLVEKLSTLGSVKIGTGKGTLGQLISAGTQILLDEADRATGQTSGSERLKEIQHAEDIRRKVEAIAAARERLKDLDPSLQVLTPELAAKTEAISKRIQNAIEDAGVAPVSIKDNPPPPSLGDGARNAAISDIDRQRNAVLDLISDLEFENRLIGLTNEQREVEIALRRAGAAATGKQRELIESLVSSGIREQEALDRLIDAMDELRDAAGGALSAFNDSLREGEGLAGGLRSALESVFDTVIRIAEQRAIQSLFGAFGTAGGGGGLGSIIGSFFGGGGSAAATASSGVSQIASSSLGTAATRAPTVVQLVVGPGQMFEPTVAAISGAVSVQTVRTNNRGIPAMVANRQARGV